MGKVRGRVNEGEGVGGQVSVGDDLPLVDGHSGVG